MSAAPERLTPERLAERYPVLLHLTDAGAWEQIQHQGLLSTSALLDLFEIPADRRPAIEASRRPANVEITHPVHGRALIKDNRPLNLTVLRRTLVGMSEPEYLQTLNSRVFFWVSERRVARLRAAPGHRAAPRLVLRVDTAALLARHAARVELSHLNSGAVHFAANYPRGAGTFAPIADYRFGERSRVSAEPLVELTVLDGVPDLREFVLDVTPA